MVGFYLQVLDNYIDQLISNILNMFYNKLNNIMD